MNIGHCHCALHHQMLLCKHACWKSELLLNPRDAILRCYFLKRTRSSLSPLSLYTIITCHMRNKMRHNSVTIAQKPFSGRGKFLTAGAKHCFPTMFKNVAIHSKRRCCHKQTHTICLISRPCTNSGCKHVPYCTARWFL